MSIKYFGGDAHHYHALINLQITVLTGVFLFIKRSQILQGGLNIKSSVLNGKFARATGRVGDNREISFQAGLGVVSLSLIVMYLLLVGPYTEIPADAWHHLGEFQQHFTYLQQDQIRPVPNLEDLFSKYAGYWYFIHAYITHVSGITIAESLQPLTIATSVTFLLSIYIFALFIFGNGALPKRDVAVISALTMVFYVLHFGVNIFSYVRYYAVAPTILNVGVYVSAIGILMQFLRGDSTANKLLALLPIHLLLLAAVHAQEALFLIVMSVSIILLYFIELYSGKMYVGAEARGTISNWAVFTDKEVAHWRVNTVFVIAVILTIAVCIYSFLNLDRHDPLKHGRMIAVGDMLPFIKDLYILDPTRDFYEVVTTWGVFVYIAFFLFFKELRQYTYLTAGMLIPLLTVFNPAFTELFLRYSWPEVLWRICYLIPLPFVAGFVVVKSYRLVKGHAPALTKALAFVSAVLLFGLLFPIQNTYIDSRFSRLHTLAPVDDDNNYVMWRDLIEYLETNPTKGILTDPVSGYVIKGITNKRYNGYKFHKIDHTNLNRDEYSPDTFAAFAHDWLLVVNMRDGSLSINGERSGHWPENVLEVSKYYSPEFLRYVSNSPNIFKPVWSKDGITVYEIAGAA